MLCLISESEFLEKEEEKLAGVLALKQEKEDLRYSGMCICVSSIALKQEKEDLRYSGMFVVSFCISI